MDFTLNSRRAQARRNVRDAEFHLDHAIDRCRAGDSDPVIAKAIAIAACDRLAKAENEYDILHQADRPSGMSLAMA